METEPIHESSELGFTLRSDNREFTIRQKNLFDQLETAEFNSKTKLNHEDSSALKRQLICDKKSSLNHISKHTIRKQFRNKESIFKRPEAPISKCLPMRTLPDYVKNPRKWKKYSLEDVSCDDMSNRANTAAAVAFLQEMEGRKDTVEELTEVSTTKKVIFHSKKNDGIKKPTFKLSALVSTEEETSNEKPSFKSSKLIMPEYVVGQKVKHEKKIKSPKTVGIRTELKLDHLYENEDE